MCMCVTVVQERLSRLEVHESLKTYAASGGTFKAKTPEAVKTLLDDMIANNYFNGLECVSWRP